jgi:hypothetical protein
MAHRSPPRRRAFGPSATSLAFVALALGALTACGHSQPDKDYGGTSGGGGPPPKTGNGGAGGASGASGAGGDASFAVSAACKALEQQFDDNLPSVLACTVGDPTTVCNAKFRSRIVCGCDIFIATVDFEAVALLQRAILDWDSAKCGSQVKCPTDLVCPSISKGSCVANGDVGICETK